MAPANRLFVTGGQLKAAASRVCAVCCAVWRGTSLSWPVTILTLTISPPSRRLIRCQPGIQLRYIPPLPRCLLRCSPAANWGQRIVGEPGTFAVLHRLTCHLNLKVFRREGCCCNWSDFYSKINCLIIRTVSPSSPSSIWPQAFIVWKPWTALMTIIIKGNGSIKQHECLLRLILHC